MKIKLIEPGYENFNGNLGPIWFEQSVSVDHVSYADVNFISTIMRIADAETGNEVGMLLDQLAGMDLPAQTITFKTMAEIQAEEAAAAAGEGVVVEVAPEQKYTVEQLEAIADKKGIAGLREIADQFDVKGTSIAKLIEGIISAQSPSVVAIADGSDAPAGE